jgi:two-component system cell cycle sensor histidine kinase/response regulator CckA
MNLLSNAAEAMPEEGDVFVSTRNIYIDRPVKGHNGVREGEYVVLTVTDTGVGISVEDMERIFEPFYTKKIMGKSGTGLGMAVVWGTVNDHDGYIDVDSHEGQGTSFSLYFPATSMQRQVRDDHLPRDHYIGTGETVLVIDDMAEQRELAVTILTRLGYTAEAVSSGEDAVEYLRHTRVDLVILDMIMEPGIDGLETYRRILELRPGQKAVIASGFSETDRVREAQKLGAGAYIRKPYLIETIGMAVRGELDR